MPGRPREAGFTLIELIVAAVLLSVVLAVATSGLMGSLSGATSSGSGMAGDAAMARAGAVLSDDVMRAVTQDRRDNLLRDPFELQEALQRNETARSSDLSDPRVIDMDDVVTATPDTLRLQADVSNQPGSECVTWSMGTSKDGNAELRRLVERTCGGKQVENRVMFTSRKVKGQVNLQPFRYRLICNRAQCASAPSGPNCAPWLDASPKPGQRRWIIGVEASFDVVTTGRSATKSSTSVRAAIRSRETDSYRRGLGC